MSPPSLDPVRADPFLIPEPFVVSVSGGRTSGMMLRLILDAHGGKLPPNGHAVFNNTGKEKEETLAFVEEISRRWSVPIHWLEYRYEPGRHYFEEVDLRTASRKGEPFRMAIQARGFLPNPIMRFCTAELKIRTTNRFVRQSLGWKQYHNAIGLRGDELKRVAKLRKKRATIEERTLFGSEKRIERAADHPPGESPLCPLFDADVTNDDVLDFWKRQPFDLQLPVDAATGKTLGGNCDLCFLKGVGNIVATIRDDPASANWWIESETLIEHRDRPETARFRADRPSYADMRRIALGHVPGTFQFLDSDGMDCGAVIECNCTD